MRQKFEPLAGTTWKAHVDNVDIFVDDQNGQPEPAQLDIASRIATDLASVRAKATSYLDIFVDRLKACGRPGEDWWLDEIELRGMSKDDPHVSLYFSLHGDDGGLWTVEMRALADRMHPIRFERLQG